MVIQGTLDGVGLTVSLKPAALSVMFGASEVLTYDRGGRLWFCLRDGHSFRRGINGDVLEKWAAAGRLQRRRQGRDEAAALVDRCASRLRDLQAQMEAGRVAWEAAPPAELGAAIAQAAAYDSVAEAADVARFAQVYDPIGILPPDQYRAVVLQATQGCSFNTCTFCDFYKGRRFRVKAPEEFRAHARAVRDYLGASLQLRTSVFLGEANALAAPQERLVALLRITGEEFGEQPVHAFQDGFSGQRKSAADYRELAALGLRRVSIGLESGHDPLLAFVRKPSSAAEVAASVATLKEAGVAVSLIVLVGLGGDRYAAGHTADTVALLNRLPLGADDLIYLSDLVEHERTPYPAQARAAGINPLAPAELRAQRAAITAGLRCGPGGPRLATYDIHEFVY